jgi:hypothetical protein
MKTFKPYYLKLATLVALIFLIASCNLERKVDLVLTYTYEDSFAISEPDGEWDESITVTYDDIADDLDLNDIEVIRLDIEAVGFTADGAPAALTGVEELFLTISTPTIQEQVIVQNETIDGVAGADTVYVTSLVEAGVLTLRDKMQGMVLGTDFESFTLRTTGKSKPNGTPLTMDLNVFLRVGIVTSEEL